MAQTISQSLIARLGAELSGFKKGMRSAVNQSEKAGKAIKTNIGKASAAAVKLAKNVGLIGVAVLGLGALAVREFVQWEEALTGVAKTVDATNEQIQALGQSFVQMSEIIPVSANELARLGEVAGQLGVDLPNIRDFVEIAAALGVSTNLMSEEAATGLARFSNVMGTSVSDVGRLGSVIVDLGNNMATTEREILEMGQRLSAAGKQIRLSESDVFGFAAALSSVGINAEAGGTAFSRVFADIASAVASGGKKLESFARIAGQSVEGFRRSFREDAAIAIIDFIDGLNRLDKAGENVFATLESVGFQNVRIRNSLLSAKNAGDLLRESIALGNRAWDDNTALTEEAERFYDRLGARLIQLRNKISNVAAEMGERLTPAVDASIGVVSGLLDRIRDAGPALGEFAETAASAIPTMAEKVVNAIGSIGLKLITVVEFFKTNTFTGGLGLVGLVFLGPQGAAALGTIGFVIDTLIEKFGGAQTVATALNEKLELQIRQQEGLLNLAKQLESIGGGPETFATQRAAEFRAEAELLGESILGIRRTIQGLTTEDFIAIGAEGASGFDLVTDAIKNALTVMKDFKFEMAAPPSLPEVAAETAEAFDTMRMKFEPLPLLTGEVTANLDDGIKKTSLLALEFKANLAASVEGVVNSIASGIGGALADIITATKSIMEGFQAIAQVIVREVITALIRAAIVAAVLKPVLGGLGIPLPPSFAKGGIVPGSGATPVIAHGGEVVLSRESVAALGGAAQANAINQGAAPAAMGSQSVEVSLSFPEGSSLPRPIDFGIIAAEPNMLRWFSAMLDQARATGMVRT